MVYDIHVDEYLGFEDIREMIRYSSDRPILKEWSKTNKHIEMRRFLPRGRVSRRRDHFHVITSRRWESFGCKISNIHDEEATEEDKKYFKEAGWRKFENPSIIEEFLIKADQND